MPLLLESINTLAYTKIARSNQLNQEHPIFLVLQSDTAGVESPVKAFYYSLPKKKIDKPSQFFCSSSSFSMLNQIL